MYTIHSYHSSKNRAGALRPKQRNHQTAAAVHIDCWPSADRRLVVTRAGVEEQSSVNSYTNRNINQIDQLLSGLSELRQKQQQGMLQPDEDEMDLDEFEDEAEGKEWVWWRAEDTAEAAAATTADSSAVEATAGNSSSNSSSRSSRSTQGQQQSGEQSTEAHQQAAGDAVKVEQRAVAAQQASDAPGTVHSLAASGAIDMPADATRGSGRLRRRRHTPARAQ